MEPGILATALERFGGTAAERRAVSRAARDMADDGRYETDIGVPLTVERVVDELEDAPRGGPAERWNWWVESLQVAYGGYREFLVHQWADEE